MTLGNEHAQQRQMLDRPWNGELALMVERQHVTMQISAEIPPDAGRQRRHKGAAIRGQPALAPQARSMRAHDQILDQKVLKAFEARSGWSRGAKDTLVMDDELRGLGATPTGLVARA
jgi:hypothetical protein